MGAAHAIARVTSAALVVCGAHLLIRAMTGKSLLAHLRDMLAAEPKLSLESSRDTVDEASWESFPASDPPALSPKT